MPFLLQVEPRTHKVILQSKEYKFLTSTKLHNHHASCRGRC